MIFNMKNSSAVAVVLISGAALLGWWTDHATLAAWLPAIANMTFNTAFCFMLTALACCMSDRPQHRRRAIQIGLGAAVGVFAALSLTQDIFSLDFGIDNFLFDSHGFGLSNPWPGRMSPMTASGFLLSSIILFALNILKQQYFTLTHMLILLLILLASIGIGMGILMSDTPSAYLHLASISPFTALSFMLLSISFLCIFRTRRNSSADLLLYSGIQMMYRLKYPQKFALISIVFMIPLATLMWNELNLHQQYIRQAKLKLIGLQHINETNQLIRAIAAHRGMANAHLSNPAIFSTLLQARTEAIDHLFAKNAVMDRLEAASIKVPDDWPGILARWSKIKASPDDDISSWRLHTEIIALMNKHLRAVGKQTMLSYDSNPIIHNLLVLQLEVMPNLLEQIAQLRGQGAGFLAKKKITHQDQIILATMTSNISILLEEANQLLHDQYATAHSVATDAAITNLFDRNKAFITVAKQQLIQNKQLSITVKDYFMLGTDAIESGHVFSQRNMAYIKHLLHERINASITAQYNIKLMAVSIALILFFLLAAFYRSVMNTITTLDQVSKKMRRGETEGLEAIPASDEMGDIVGSFNAIAEELMRVSSRMSAAVDYAVDGIITIDEHGIIKSFNPASEHIFTYACDEVIGQNITMLIPEQYRHRHLAGLQHYCETGKGKVVGSAVEVMGLKKNGDEFPMELSINAMLIDEQQMFIGMVRDISEKQQLEDQLRHAQKMEAVGALVGGVAHNFNNLLAGIVGKAYLAKRKSEDNPKVLSYLESIEAISAQAGDMIKQLLTFAHKDFFRDQQDAHLDILIKEAFKTASLGISEDIKLELQMMSANIMVHCDANQVQQVLMNMMNNARDAQEGAADKKILVHLKTCRPDATFFQRHEELANGVYACLSITDNGHGMDAETLEKVFDPFYTTKEVGKGTGLGLSTAFGTITSHHGTIEVDSQIGNGTSFRIYLPVVETAQNYVKNKQKQQAVHSSEHETLLLVDDEPLILHSMKEVLEELGYHVIKASNGMQGLERFKKHQHQIDAIITDVVMPDMSGVEMFRKIRAINSRISTIFITGYDQDKIHLHSNEQNNTLILSKPLQITELSHHIKTMLEQ